MRICVVALTYNECVILPHFLRHYAFADRLIFFDGGSTDGTREMILRTPNCELREHDTHGEVDDLANIYVKNTVCKTLDADWFVVVDADEFVYHPDLREFLQATERDGYNALQCKSWQMVGDAMPDPSLPLTEQIRCGVRDEYSRKYFDKVCVFKGDVDIGYAPGAHSYNARGLVLSPVKSVKLLHYKWLCREDVERKSRVVLSESNHRYKLGYEADGATGPSRWLERYDQMRAQRVRVL